MFHKDSKKSQKKFPRKRKMNKKIIFGVFLPLIIIIFLITLNILNVGLTITQENPKYIFLSSLFNEEDEPTKSTILQTYLLDNDFFLSRKYKLPNVNICLVDNEKVRSMIDFEVIYKKGFFEEKDLKYVSYLDISNRWINLPSNSQTAFVIMINTLKKYSTSKHNSYEEFDELIIVEFKDDLYHITCSELTDEMIENAVHIPIKK